MTSKKRPVDRVLEALGGPSKAAAALSISNPSVVMNWRKRGQVPADRVLEIEALTGISATELRPDVFRLLSKSRDGARPKKMAANPKVAAGAI